MSEQLSGRDGVINDVICLSLPAEIDPAVYLDHPDETVRTAFMRKLSDLAQGQVWNQWPGERAPIRVDWERMEWLITSEIDAVQRFQPAHDCAQCRLGNTRAEAFLREFPGRWIAMGNIRYTPVWSEG